MPLSGSLKTLPAGDLLEWLDRRQRSGELSLSRGAVAKTFRIEGGAVTQASSSDPREYLGQYLVDLGYLSAKEHSRVSLVKLESTALLGQLLTAVGLVSDVEVRDCLSRKITDAVCDVIAWADGSFRFEEDVLAGLNGDVTLAIPLAELLRESGERVRTWEQIRRLVPDRRARLRRPAGDEPAGDEAAAGAATETPPPVAAAAPQNGRGRQPIEQVIDEELRRAASFGQALDEVLVRRRSLEYTVMSRLLSLCRAGELEVDPGAQRAAAPRRKA
jgi:hypothetical protein